MTFASKVSVPFVYLHSVSTFYKGPELKLYAQNGTIPVITLTS